MSDKVAHLVTPTVLLVTSRYLNFAIASRTHDEF